MGAVIWVAGVFLVVACGSGSGVKDDTPIATASSPEEDPVCCSSRYVTWVDGSWSIVERTRSA